MALGMIISVGILGYLWLWLEKTNTELPKQGEVESNIKTKNKNIIDLNYLDSTLRIVWFEVPNPNEIFLFSNLDEKKTAKALMQEKGCKNIVSGGFYTKEGEHIGLFVTEGEMLKKWAKNALFNGVFGIDSEGVVFVSEDMTQKDFRFAVQAGPILIKNNSAQSLKLKNDQRERRIVVGTSEEGKAIFLVLFNPKSLFIGPNLAGLPSVLKMFEEKSGIKFKDALNLDGGTASAFYSQEISLAELSPIGSFFCIK